MLFADEQLTATTAIQKLTEDTYTISNQHADYAIYSLSGANIKYRSDGLDTAPNNIAQVDNVYTIPNRKAVEGFRFVEVSGTPVLDIQYVMLEWTDLRRLYIEKLRPAPQRRGRTLTHRTELGTGAMQIRRVQSRPLHEFSLESFYIRGMKEEQELHGFFSYHQGDKPFLLHAGKYSVVEYPKLVGYGDGSTESLFLPARFIIPHTLKVFFDGLEVDSYSLNHASGLLTFISVLPLNVIVSATYSYYYKCVFIDDAFDDMLIGRGDGDLIRTYKLKEVSP